MNNGDLPANPVRGANNVPFDSKQGFPSGLTVGLTKREYFAAMAMQGMLSNNHLNGGNGFSGDEISNLSAQAADSLLKALESKEGEQ